MTHRQRAQREIARAAERAIRAEQELADLDRQMIEEGQSPDLDRKEAVSEAASRLRSLSESTG